MTFRDIVSRVNLDEQEQQELRALIANTCMLADHSNQKATPEQTALFQRFHMVAQKQTLVIPEILVAVSRALNITNSLFAVDAINATVAWLFLRTILPETHRLPEPPIAVARCICILLTYQKQFETFSRQAAGVTQLRYTPPTYIGWTDRDTRPIRLRTFDEIEELLPWTKGSQAAFAGLGEITNALRFAD